MAFFLKSEFMKNNLLKNYFFSLGKLSRGFADKTITESEKLASMSPQELLKNKVKPTSYSKLILVWTGRFKNSAEVPEFVTFETMQKARNMARIKMSNYMMVATVVGCVVMVYAGKKAAEAGESVSKMNMDWHKEYNAQAKAEAEAKNAKNN